MKTLALYNVKGGVGKSAAAVNLAYFAAAAGVHTLLWDLDSQAASTWYLHGDPGDAKLKRVLDGSTPLGRLVKPTPYERLCLIPAESSYRYFDVMLRKVEPPREALKRLLRPFSEQYSLAVLDCPPALSHVAENVFVAADLILVPVVPTHLSLRAYQQLCDYFVAEKLSLKKLKPFFSMADRRRSLHRTLLEEPPALLKNLAGAVIPYSSMVERMGEHRAPLAAYAPADDPALLGYAELWLESSRALAL